MAGLSVIYVRGLGYIILRQIVRCAGKKVWGLGVSLEQAIREKGGIL